MQPNNNDNPNPQPPIWQQPPPLYPVPPAPPMPQAEPQLPEPQQSPGTEPAYTTAVPQRQSLRKRLIMTLIALIAAALVATVLYVAFVKGNDGAPTNGQPNVTFNPMTSLQGASVLPPADLERYRPSPNSSPTDMRYATSEGNCRLEMGVASPERLPGKDNDALVGLHLNKYRDDKLKVDGPKKGNQLELLDATDSTKGYTLPTVTYTASDKATFITGRYSVAILKNGERVYAIRTCETKDKPASDERLDAIDKDLRTASVIPE